MRVRAFAIYFDFEYIFFVEGSVASEKNARELPSKYNFDLLPPAPPISMLAFVAEMPATETSVYFSTATSPTHSTPTLSAGARGGALSSQFNFETRVIFSLATGRTS